MKGNTKQQHGIKFDLQGLSRDEVEEQMLMKVVEKLDIPSLTKATIIRNIHDDTWLKSSDESIVSMMVARPKVLKEMHKQFYRLTDEMGWKREVAQEYADVIIPLLDMAERSGYTRYGHQLRSMQYAEMILDEMGMKEREKAVMLFSILVHDIGKAGIANELMRKVNLRAHEMLIMGSHSGMSWEILSSLFNSIGKVRKEDATEITEIAKHHHENSEKIGTAGDWKKWGIPLGERVTAIADSFDAMTSFRTYHNHKSIDEAVEAITNKYKHELDQHIEKFLISILNDEMKRERIERIVIEGGGKP